MIAVRPYRMSDFHAALDVINAAATADRTRRMTEEMFRRSWGNLGVASEVTTAAIATVQDDVVGFLWWDAALRPNRRLDGCVHPEWRRRGVETVLLTAAESWIREQQAPVTVSGRVYSDIPGGEELFRLKGYQEVRRFYRMTTTLPGRDYEVEPPPGIVLRSFRPRDLAALVEADNEIFAEHWGSQPHTIQSWSRTFIDMRPHDPDLWVLAWEGDWIVGECLCHESLEGNTDNGYVTVVGVRSPLRGRGLGHVVLSEGMRRLQQAGFVDVSLQVDAENMPAVKLYRSLGMEVSRTRVHVAKTLPR